MYSTTVYLYQQKYQVIMIDTVGDSVSFQRRWEPVYSKKLTINKGVDNVILFEFVNQDQKPVNISGSDLVFRVFDTAGTTTLYTKDLVILNATYGRAKVVINREDFVTVDAQPGGWSIERSSGVLQEPIFVNDNASARGQVDIVDSVKATFEPSQPMTIPTHGSPSINNPNRVHTSEVFTKGRDLVTFQLDFDNFTGNIKAQGSDSYLGPWYDVGSQRQYTNQFEKDHFNVSGHHTYLRFEINQYGNGATANLQVATGNVTDATITSGGSNWFGVTAPRVAINGLGTDATATAIVSNGVVSTMAITSGGEGYNVIPNYVIDTGAITRIVFR